MLIETMHVKGTIISREGQDQKESITQETEDCCCAGQKQW